MQREILLTGIGGQGVQLCGKTLAMAATAEGRQALLSSHYGGEMRGGQTEATVVVADRDLRSLPIVAQAWSAIAFHDKFFPSVAARLRPGSVVMADSTVVSPGFAADLADVCPGVQVLGVEAGKVAVALGFPHSSAFVLLGAYGAWTAVVDLGSLVAAMIKLVPPYRTQHLAANEAALRAGAALVPCGAASAWTSATAPVAEAPAC